MLLICAPPATSALLPTPVCPVLPVFSRPDQPDIRMEEAIEAQRLNNPVKTNPMAQPSMMGIIGMGPQGAPGAVPPQFPGNGPGFMPTTDQYLMTPGSTPRKEGKSKKK